MANNVSYISMRGLPSWANGDLELVRKKMDLYVQYKTGDLKVPVIGKYIKEAYAGNANSTPAITGFGVRPDLLMGLIWASNNLFGYGGYPLAGEKDYAILRTKGFKDHNPLNIACGPMNRIIAPKNWRMGTLLTAARVQSFFNQPGTNDHPNGFQFDPCYRAVKPKPEGDWEKLTQAWGRPSDDLYGICALLLNNTVKQGINDTAIALGDKTLYYAEQIRLTSTGSPGNGDPGNGDPGNGGPSDPGNGNPDDGDNDDNPIDNNTIPFLPTVKELASLAEKYWWIGVGVAGVAYLAYNTKIKPTAGRNIKSSVE